MGTILVIDDEELARFTIRQMLEQAGHMVLEAENGNQGIKLQQQENCDLIITDIIMPEKGGLSTIAEMKSGNAYLKIIAISGGERRDGHDYLGHAANLGANRTLGKPFTGEELLECVKACLLEDEDHPFKPSKPKTQRSIILNASCPRNSFACWVPGI